MLPLKPDDGPGSFDLIKLSIDLPKTRLIFLIKGGLDNSVFITGGHYAAILR